MGEKSALAPLKTEGSRTRTESDSPERTDRKLRKPAITLLEVIEHQNTHREYTARYSNVKR